MSKKKIFVYVADTAALYDDAVFAIAYRNVSHERRAKVDQFLFKKDKVLSLGAELLLQYGLNAHGITEYEMGYGKNGKPYLQRCKYQDESMGNRALPHFNLSHSEERIMCVISDCAVGCDVEKVTDIELEVAEHIFPPKEYEKIASQRTYEAQKNMFFKLWTLKESLMKATGLGMELSPESFCVDIRNGNDGYHFEEYELFDGYRYAVCGLADEFESLLETVDLIISHSSQNSRKSSHK